MNYPKLKNNDQMNKQLLNSNNYSRYNNNTNNQNSHNNHHNSHSQNPQVKLTNSLQNHPYKLNNLNKNSNQSSVKNLIAKTEKPVISNSLLTRNIVQTARHNQPAVFGEKNKNYSLSPSRQVVNKKFLPDKKHTKKTLILDLDETLVHSGFKPFKVQSDMVLKIELEGRIHDIHVLIRPGAQEFLDKMAEIYELVIFTASLSKYADPLVDRLDPKKKCTYRLFREHCTVVGTERGIAYVKDLRFVNRDLKHTILLDNNPNSYAVNIDNGMPIKTWIDDMKDRELINYIPVLEYLATVKNIQDVLHLMITNNELDYNKCFNLMKDSSYSGSKTNSKNTSKQVSNKNLLNMNNNNNNTNKMDDSEGFRNSIGGGGSNTNDNNNNSSMNIPKPSINIKIINHNFNNYIVKNDDINPNNINNINNNDNNKLNKSNNNNNNNNNTNSNVSIPSIKTNFNQPSSNKHKSNYSSINNNNNNNSNIIINKEERKTTKNKSFRDSFGDVYLQNSTINNFFNSKTNTNITNNAINPLTNSINNLNSNVNINSNDGNFNSLLPTQHKVNASSDFSNNKIINDLNNKKKTYTNTNKVSLREKDSFYNNINNSTNNNSNSMKKPPSFVISKKDSSSNMNTINNSSVSNRKEIREMKDLKIPPTYTPNHHSLGYNNLNSSNSNNNNFNKTSYVVNNNSNNNNNNSGNNQLATGILSYSITKNSSTSLLNNNNNNTNNNININNNTNNNMNSSISKQQVLKQNILNTSSKIQYQINKSKINSNVNDNTTTKSNNSNNNFYNNLNRPNTASLLNNNANANTNNNKTTTTIYNHQRGYSGNYNFTPQEKNKEMPVTVNPHYHSKTPSYTYNKNPQFIQYDNKYISGQNDNFKNTNSGINNNLVNIVDVSSNLGFNKYLNNSNSNNNNNNNINTNINNNGNNGFELSLKKGNSSVTQRDWYNHQGLSEIKSKTLKHSSNNINNTNNINNINNNTNSKTTTHHMRPNSSIKNGLTTSHPSLLSIESLNTKFNLNTVKHKMNKDIILKSNSTINNSNANSTKKILTARPLSIQAKRLNAINSINSMNNDDGFYNNKNNNNSNIYSNININTYQKNYQNSYLGDNSNNNNTSRISNSNFIDKSHLKNDSSYKEKLNSSSFKQKYNGYNSGVGVLGNGYNNSNSSNINNLSSNLGGLSLGGKRKGSNYLINSGIKSIRDNN